jgi:hypothetical protein
MEGILDSISSSVANFAKKRSCEIALAMHFKPAYPAGWQARRQAKVVMVVIQRKEKENRISSRDRYWDQRLPGGDLR